MTWFSRRQRFHHNNYDSKIDNDNAARRIWIFILHAAERGGSLRPDDGKAAGGGGDLCSEEI